MSSILQSVPFCSLFSWQLRLPFSCSISKFLSRGTAVCSLSQDMDIIEIDSSESEDDVGSGHVESEGKAFTHGGFDQSPEGSAHDSRQKEPQIEVDSIFIDKHGDDENFPSQYLEKRTLPLPFLPTILTTASRPGVKSHRGPVLSPQSKEAIQAGHGDGFKVDLNGINKDTQQPGAESSQQTQKRSLQQAMYKTASEGSHDSIRANADDHNIYMEDDVGGTVDKFNTHGTNDRCRRLPSSLNEYSRSAVGNSADGLRRLPPLSRNLDSKSNSSIGSRDIHNYENAGTYRALPLSLTCGRSGSSSQPAGASDAGNRIGTGEGYRIEHDERAIYQEALQNLGQSKLEGDLPEGLLTVPLLKHQKSALAWMVKKEKSVHCAGGILADDQGLGKTISMIALIQKQRTLQDKFTSESSRRVESEALNLDDDDDGVNEVDKAKQCEENDFQKKPVASTSVHASLNWKPAAGTLVVCPASILRQWAHELDEKVTECAKLSVIIYHGGTRTKDPSELAKYDVVLTTYSLVTNEVPKQTLVEDNDGEHKNLESCGSSSEVFGNKKKKQTSNAGKMSKKKRKGVKNSHFDYASGPLARVRWFRVILDEAQTIKNHRTQVARACCGLRAKRRWCLSGTPIQNAVDDLYSYFQFLKYDPYAKYSSFCSLIKHPISRDASYGYKKLQAVLHAVLLRRTKGTVINGEPIVDLPPKKMDPKSVDFSIEERAFYLKLEADSRKQFKAYAAAGTVRQNYASILLMLLRLRQACDHPYLVKGYHSDIVEKDSLAIAKQLPREMLSKLLKPLENSFAICGVCSDPPENAVVAMCGHVFCYQCISERLTSDDNLCPVASCKDILGTDSVFSQATLKSCISGERYNNPTTSSAHDEECSIEHSSYTSAKIRAVLEILNSICCQNASFESEEYNERDCYPFMDFDHISGGPNSDENAKPKSCAHMNSCTKMPIKAIVFSQWTTMLDLVESALNRSLIQYRRLDGLMSLVKRDRALKDFNDDPEVTVMLMSLKAGSLGLNMVAACHVILLDLWWNPATEDQAVDRAHRIGQTRPVTVSRITIKDTVEDRILQLQEEKRNMVSSAFGEDQNGCRATRLTTDDLNYLFML